METPKLSRSFLGYRRSEVAHFLSQQQAALHVTTGRVRAAEERAAELESKALDLQSKTEALQTRAADLESQISRLAEQVAERDGAGEATARIITEELASVLSQAEQAAERMVERAREATQEQLTRAQEAWDEVQTEVKRLTSWQRRIEPLVGRLAASVEQARSHIDDVPNRIQEALAPVAEAISVVEGDLLSVAEASRPPVFLTPSAVRAAPESAEPSAADIEEPAEEAIIVLSEEEPASAGSPSQATPGQQAGGS